MSRLSASFIWLIPFRRPPESPAPCWRTVATIYPLGNCDSLRPETSLNYLNQIGTVSNRSFLLSSCFRVYRRRANVARGTGESCLPQRSFDSQRGVESTSLTQPFPSRLGLSRSRPTSILRFLLTNSVLSMNWKQTNTSDESNNDFLSTSYSPRASLDGLIDCSIDPIKSASKQAYRNQSFRRKKLGIWMVNNFDDEVLRPITNPARQPAVAVLVASSTKAGVALISFAEKN